MESTCGARIGAVMAAGIVLNESSATVAEAAHALGVEPASIAKTLSVLQGEKPVLIVTEGWVDVCKEPESE